MGYKRKIEEEEKEEEGGSRGYNNRGLELNARRRVGVEDGDAWLTTTDD